MEHYKNTSIKNIETEVWMPLRVRVKDSIVDFKGLYEVSNFGRVKAIGRKIPMPNSGFVITKDIIKKQCISTWGYLSVGLSKKGKTINTFSHRIVATTFVENPLNKPFVNHKNGVKTDSHANNLEWCTSSENNKHATDTGLRKHPCLGKFGKNHPRSKSIAQYDLSMKEINVFGSINEAGRDTGICSRQINNTCLGKQKTAHGYIWKYK